MSDVSASHKAFRFSRTTYLWLALLFLSYLAPLPRPTAAVPRVAAGRETSERLQTEFHVRLAVGARAIGAGATLDQSARSASDTLCRYARESRSADLARRALVARASLDQPFDPTLLDLLKSEPERRLWRALYGPKPRPTPQESDEALLRTLHLGFWQERALSDLARRRGDERAARAAEERFRARNRQDQTRWLGTLGILLLAGAGGVALWILFLYAARTGRWPLLAREATRPQRLGWEELVDSFLFYLALNRILGMVVGVFLTGRPALLVPALAGVQIAGGVGAALYLAAAARRRDATLADVGLSARNLGANVLYGLAGYCAILPLIPLTTTISQRLFHRAGVTTSPNPVLPLIASEDNALMQSLLFVMAAFAAPFFEELFFRGALFSAFRTRLLWIPAALISATLFALVHPMQDWLTILAMGFVLATLREMRQSVIPGIVAHFCQNALAFLLLSLLARP